MDDVKVRERLREAFHTFSLPRMMPGAIPVPKPEGFEAITINGGRGRLRVLTRRLRFSREHEIIHTGRCDRCRAVVKDDVLVREGGGAGQRSRRCWSDVGNFLLGHLYRGSAADGDATPATKPLESLAQLVLMRTGHIWHLNGERSRDAKGSRRRRRLGDPLVGHVRPAA